MEKIREHKATIGQQCGYWLVGLLLASLIAELMLTICWSRGDHSCITSFLAEQEAVIMVLWYERTLTAPFSIVCASVNPCRWLDDGACHWLLRRARNLRVF